MNREKFIKRLESVGFEEKYYSSTYYLQTANIIHPIIIIKNKPNSFTWNKDLYTFNELEQFLVDKGIVKDFNAHEYLLVNGFGKFLKGNYEYLRNPNFYIFVSLACNTLSIHCDISGNEWTFDKITKQSCDKAIKLIKFLEELEQSNEN